MLCRHSALDVDRHDKWGRTVLEVASKACRDYLDGLGEGRLLGYEQAPNLRDAVLLRILIYDSYFK